MLGFPLLIPLLNLLRPVAANLASTNPVLLFRSYGFTGGILLSLPDGAFRLALNLWCAGGSAILPLNLPGAVCLISFRRPDHT